MLSKNNCLRVSIAMKKDHNHGSPYKEKHLTRVSLQFRGFIHYHHGGKHGGTQVGMVTEKELRVLHKNQQAAARESCWA